MITRVQQTFDVSCDHCSMTEEFTVKDWSDLMADMKEGGWVSFKDKDGEWKHKCAECRKK